MTTVQDIYKPKEVIAALRKHNGHIFLTARALRINYTSVRGYIQRYPEVKEAFQAIRGEMVDTAENKLRDAIDNGEQWAVLFVLRTLGKDRGYVEREAPGAADGAPAAHVIRLPSKAKTIKDWEKDHQPAAFKVMHGRNHQQGG